MAASPLGDRAGAKLVVGDLIGDGRIRHCDTQREIVLDDAGGVAGLLDEA